ncbi:large subunit ribosomal protein L9 [Anaerosphaera aminiphila DSM 21120]|uniref:Large ribosomal subunit protein bL9 n=1 Tax=Anaerosphaera aminiphila DSM 21120 TaxID=1120995 RepID=A0A1M5USB3_9FIRM|nr:50S ribosomal protein L9 [Anaerosphaera aminiphila]SHH65889.1 large subunit ribosomal protein L9 [Anaerosphaera aminiphila DSM 21120]
MKVILLKDDKNLGKAGDLVEAKDGYARNFLIPRKVAIEATTKNLENWKEQKKVEAEEEKQRRADATELKKQIEKNKVVLSAKAGEGGRLFGAITSKDIQEAIKEQLKLDVDKKKIDLKENIKTEGMSEVDIKLYSEIIASLKVVVEAK